MIHSATGQVIGVPPGAPAQTVVYLPSVSSAPGVPGPGEQPIPLMEPKELSYGKRVSRTKQNLVGFCCGPLYREDVASQTVPMEQQVRYFAVSTMKKFIGEVFGTFALVFCITALATGVAYSKSIMSPEALEYSNFDVDNVTVGLVHGLTLTGLIYALGYVSGAHLNPGVTLSLALSGSFHWSKVLYYWLAQFAGAFMASGIVYGIFGNVGNLGANIPNPGVSSVMAFSMEVCLVWIFFFVINVVQDRGDLVGKHAAIAVGATFVATALVAGPVTTVSFNVARSVAPAVVSGSQEAKDIIWAYITASVVGAIIASLLLRIFRDLREGAKPPLAIAIELREKEVSSRFHKRHHRH